MIDTEAVAAIRQEPITWRYKGLPVALDGCTVAQAAERGLNLFEDGFLGPVLVLDEAALSHNLTTMAKWCADRGVQLAPHAKTTMAPQLWARQIEAGAYGLTAANTAQLRVYRAFGVSRVIFANELVDPAGLRWVDEERSADPGFEFTCFVDSVEGVARMEDSLRQVGAAPVDVVVEVGRTAGRAGARSTAEATAVARAAAASPLLRLVGVGGYEGVLVNDPSPHSVSVVDEFLRRMRELTVALHREGLFETDEILLTAGGSCFFDQVADVFAGPWPGMSVTTVLRSGCYVTHDDGFYRWMSPFSRGEAGSGSLRPALKLWARVTSLPEPGLALLTAGKRDLSFDAWPPEPQLVRGADGEIRELTDCTVSAVNDQHAFITLAAGHGLAVGDWVRLGLSYPCTAFDKWQLIPVVRGETVVDFVRTYF
ncbi:amino acid deaminase [Micromonospora sp. WMMD754]|uniref:amino acid deaminase n=1 Tax=Micromonospora sp. WMMD754 TaxID=3404114 RepID=UPI003BF5BC11